MSSMQTIWSGVKRWTSGLFSRSQGESSGEKDLRERLDQRVEAEQQKASQLGEIERRVKGLESAIGSLRGSIGQLQRKLSQSQTKQDKLRKQQEEAATQVRRFRATLRKEEDQLGEIEEMRDMMKGMARYLASLVLIVSTIGALIAQALWHFVVWIL